MGTVRPHRTPARLRPVVIGAMAALAACQARVLPRMDPPPLPEGVVAEVRETTYPVSGYSVRALDASLKANGPMWDGEHRWGLVQWRIQWNARPVEQDGMCRLDALHVLVQVDITLPEWRTETGASRDLRIRWDEFVTSLRVHESGHRDRAYLAGEEVQATLSAVRTESCLTIAELADARATAVVLRHQQLDRAYDQASQRGQAQGAVWPPGSS